MSEGEIKFYKRENYETIERQKDGTIVFIHCHICDYLRNLRENRNVGI